MTKLILIASSLIIVGCAQIGEINKQLAGWADEIIKVRDANKQQISGNFTSKRDIDTLYTRIKREFDFETIEEALKGCNPKLNSTCAWKEMAVRDGGYVHEKTPGVYYKVGHSVSNPKNNQESFYVEVMLEKEGKYTLVSYKTIGSHAWAEDVKTRLQKTIK